MPCENIMLHILRISVCVQPLLSDSYSSDCRQNILDMGWHLYGMFFFWNYASIMRMYLVAHQHLQPPATVYCVSLRIKPNCHLTSVLVC